jgi:hypothetical protein
MKMMTYTQATDAAAKTTNAQLLQACQDLLPLALAHLQDLCGELPSSPDDTPEGLTAPEKWELSRRYYAAVRAVAEAEAVAP